MLDGIGGDQACMTWRDFLFPNLNKELEVRSFPAMAHVMTLPLTELFYF